MTDDLVKYLRNEMIGRPNCIRPDYGCVRGDCPCDDNDRLLAADRIEALEKALSEYAKPNCRSCGSKGYLTIALPDDVDIRACYECVEIFDHVEELEKALREIAKSKKSDCEQAFIYKIIARVALGEKKDGVD